MTYTDDFPHGRELSFGGINSVGVANGGCEQSLPGLTVGGNIFPNTFPVTNTGNTVTTKKTTVEEFDENEKMVKRTITEETVTTYPDYTYPQVWNVNSWDQQLKA